MCKNQFREPSHDVARWKSTIKMRCVHHYLLGGNPKTKLRGTENETSDEIHGKHHGDAMVKRMHGHRDQTLEWRALYFKKEESSL